MTGSVDPKAQFEEHQASLKDAKIINAATKRFSKVLNMVQAMIDEHVVEPILVSRDHGYRENLGTESPALESELVACM